MFKGKRMGLRVELSCGRSPKPKGLEPSTSGLTGIRPTFHTPVTPNIYRDTGGWFSQNKKVR
jgi:hypothetical protein